MRFEWIANQLKQNLGVDAALDPVDPTAYTALVKDPATTPQMLYLGWCADYPDPESIITSLTADQLEPMLPRLESGMAPKMEACLRAVRSGVGQAHVIDGRVPHSVLLEVFTHEGVGTMVLPDAAAPERSDGVTAG